MNFSDFFKKFLNEKKFRNPYHLSEVSKNMENVPQLTRDYLSKLVNNPILNPIEKTCQKLAEVIAKHNNTPYEQELKDVQEFFEKARQKFGEKARQKFGDSTKSAETRPYTFIFEGIDDPVNIEAHEQEIYNLVNKLKKLGKGEIVLKDIKEGSIILLLESTLEVFENIDLLYKEGKLNDLLGVNVLKLQLEEEELELGSSESSSESQLKWVQSQIQANWNIEYFKRVWQELEIPVLFDYIFFPSDLQLALNNFRDDKDKDKDKDKWKFSKIELSNLQSVLVVWLKPDDQSFDLLVQLYTSENLPSMLENLELKLYSGNECLQTVTSRKSDVRIQSDTYTFEWDESVDIHIIYQDFRFVHSVYDLVL